MSFFLFISQSVIIRLSYVTNIDSLFFGGGGKGGGRGGMCLKYQAG